MIVLIIYGADVRNLSITIEINSECQDLLTELRSVFNENVFTIVKKNDETYKRIRLYIELKDENTTIFKQSEMNLLTDVLLDIYLRFSDSVIYSNISYNAVSDSGGCVTIEIESDLATMRRI